MTDLNEPDTTKAEPAAQPEYFVVSLQEGFDAFVASHKKRAPLGRRNSTFVQRSWERLRSKDRSILTVADIVNDAAASSLHQMDADALHTERFLHELRFRMLPAIGYLMPRAEGSRPVVIPNEVWQNADHDFMRGMVSGAGLSFAHVQIVMMGSFPEAHETDCFYPDPLPVLDRFAPSEDLRLLWKIPATDPPQAQPKLQPDHPEPARNQPPAPSGRPSYRVQTIAAFHAISKNPHWKNKQLAGAIREYVLQQLHQTDETGLGDDTILKLVRPLWHDYKRKPPEA